jgi:hypothetical protein
MPAGSLFKGLLVGGLASAGGSAWQMPGRMPAVGIGSRSLFSSSSNENDNRHNKVYGISRRVVCFVGWVRQS